MIIEFRISVQHIRNFIISVAHTDTKFYYQSVFHFSPTKDLAPFSIHTPQKSSLKAIYYQFIEKDFHFGAAVAIDM